MYTIKMVPRDAVKVTETRGRKPGSKNKTAKKEVKKTQEQAEHEMSKFLGKVMYGDFLNPNAFSSKH